MRRWYMPSRLWWSAGQGNTRKRSARQDETAGEKAEKKVGVDIRKTKTKKVARHTSITTTPRPSTLNILSPILRLHERPARR